MADFRSATCTNKILHAAWLIAALLLTGGSVMAQAPQPEPLLPPPPPPGLPLPPTTYYPPPMPSLAPEVPTMPVSITFIGPKTSVVDEPVTIKAQVKNLGKNRFDKLVLQVDVSHNTSFGVSDVDETVTVESLGVGETREASFTFTPRRIGVFSVGSQTTANEKDNPAFFKSLDPATSKNLGTGYATRTITTSTLTTTLVRQTVVAQEGISMGRNISPVSIKPAELKIQFDPKTPIEKLLPAAPKTTIGKVRLPQTLAQVPELALEDPFAKSLTLEQTVEQTARTIDRIHHINHKKTDAFMETLLASRSDLAGLPFAMGDSCRLQEESARQFANAVASMRNARPRTLRSIPSVLGGRSSFGAISSVAIAPKDPLMEPNPGEALMATFAALFDQADKNDKRVGPSREEQSLKARVALATQVLSHEAPALKLGLVKYLAALSHVDATQALARLAIFSDDEGVRRAAADALKTRREKDYTPLLLDGLNYPWPAVAKNAADAIVQLERHDLVGNLVDVLERPDPRAPEMKEADGKKVAVVRELVKINHHRNCLLCHAPIDQESARMSQEKAAYLQTLSVQVPQPSEELPAPFAPSARYYDNTNPDILVRVDVTYLRQDFSARLPVAESQIWPEMQRFDFVVRTRAVSDEDAQAYRDQLEPRQPGVLSPYHRAALFALREMTGLDTTPTAQAWRKLLAQTSSK